MQKILREVEVPILDNEECEVRLRLTRLGGAFKLNRHSFMCAGAEPRKDACTVIFILIVKVTRSSKTTS